MHCPTGEEYCNTLRHPCFADRIPALAAAKSRVDAYDYESLLPWLVISVPNGLEHSGRALDTSCLSSSCCSQLHLQRGDRFVEAPEEISGAPSTVAGRK